MRSPRPLYPEEEVVPIKEVVAPKWREFVIEKEVDGTERVNRLNYEMCVLQDLREKVRTKEIWVVGANRFRNPDDDLPTDFEQNRTTYSGFHARPCSCASRRRISAPCTRNSRK